MPINFSKLSKFIPCLDSGYFFSNGKTSGISVDFRVCPLMRLIPLEGGKRKFASKTCEACYAVDLLNVYKNVATKLQALKSPETPGQLELFEKDCQTLHLLFPDLDKIRFYALSDFHVGDLPYIEVASKYFTVDIISKMLVFPNNEPSLRKLFNMPNVWVSLSFNEKFNKEVPRISNLLTIEDPSNVNMNYTMNYKIENPDDEYFKLFQVFHFRNTYKRDATQIFNRITETNTCALFDKQGNRVRGHGACDACNNCHVSFGQYQRGEQAALPLALAGEELIEA